VSSLEELRGKIFELINHINDEQILKIILRFIIGIKDS